LRERRRDAAVSPYFIELGRIGDFFPGHPLTYVVELLTSCRGTSARSDQKRASVWLTCGGVLRSSGSAGEASALFSEGELVQDIQEKIAPENTKREEYCD